MFMTYTEIKYGLFAMAIIAAGCLVLLLLISGVHLLVREIGRSMRRRRKRRAATTSPRKRHAEGRLYAGAGD